MNLVITGGLGFIGRNLLSTLSELEKVSVKVVAKRVESTDHQFISDLSLNCQLIESDLLDGKLLDHLESQDQIIHLAWSSNPSITGLNYESERDLNLANSRSLLEIAVKKRVKKITFLSSGGTVYGDPKYLPIDEKHDTTPISAYGKVKLQVENELIQICNQNGIDYLILRAANAYGEGINLSKAQGVIGHWIHQISENNQIRMIGNGTQTRDFIHVSDLCNSIVSTIEIRNRILNVGSGTRISLNELLDLIAKHIDRSFEVIKTPIRTFDLSNNQLNISLIKELTNWEPVISLEDGVKMLIEKYK